MMRSSSKRVARKGLDLACFVGERLGAFPDEAGDFAFEWEEEGGEIDGAWVGGGDEDLIEEEHKVIFFFLSLCCMDGQKNGTHERVGVCWVKPFLPGSRRGSKNINARGTQRQRASWGEAIMCYFLYIRDGEFAGE